MKRCNAGTPSPNSELKGEHEPVFFAHHLDLLREVEQIGAALTFQHTADIDLETIAVEANAGWQCP